MDLNRRSLITGLIALVAAPAIVRAGSLMPVKRMVTDAECQAVLDAMVNYQMSKVRIDMFNRSMYWLSGDGEIYVLDPDDIYPRSIRSETPFRADNQTNGLFISHRDS